MAGLGGDGGHHLPELRDQRPEVERGEAGAAIAPLHLRDAQGRGEHRQQRVALRDRLRDLVVQPCRLGPPRDQRQPAAQPGERGAHVVRDIVADVADLRHQSGDAIEHPVERRRLFGEGAPGRIDRQAALHVAVDDRTRGLAHLADPPADQRDEQDHADHDDRHDRAEPEQIGAAPRHPFLVDRLGLRDRGQREAAARVAHQGAARRQPRDAVAARQCRIATRQRPGQSHVAGQPAPARVAQHHADVAGVALARDRGDMRRDGARVARRGIAEDVVADRGDALVDQIDDRPLHRAMRGEAGERHRDQEGGEEGERQRSQRPQRRHGQSRSM